MVFFALTPFFILTFVSSNPVLDLIKSKILENDESKAETLAQTDIFSQAKYKNVALETCDSNQTFAWLIGPPDINEQTKIILVLHGNNDNRETFCKNYEIESVITTNNFALLIVDYRDFGDSKGEFDKNTVIFDVAACLEFLHSELKLDNVDAVAISLGSGIFFEYLSYCDSDEKKKEHCLLDKPFSGESKLSPDTIDKLKSLLNTNDEIKFKAEEKETARIQRLALISPIKSIFEAAKNIIHLKNFPNLMMTPINKFVLTKFAFDNTEKVSMMPKENIKVFHGTEDDLIPVEQIEELMSDNENALVKLEGEDHASSIKSQETWKQVHDFLK